MSVAIHDMPSARRVAERPNPGANRSSGWLNVAVCGVGASASLALTVLKHLSDVSCRVDIFSACKLREHVDCGAVLNSAWSQLWGVPTSAHATCLYLAALIPGVRLAKGWGSPLQAWRALALLSAVSLGATIAMATYAGVVVGSFCVYCAFLYTTSIAFAAAALWARPPRTATARPATGADAWVLPASLVSAFLVALAAHSWVLDATRRSEFMLTGCSRRVEPPPATALRLGGASPRVVVMEALDPTCPHCRQSFGHTRQLLAESRFRDTVSIRVFLFPRTADSRCTPIIEREKDGERDLDEDSCLAALAVQCAEQARPGAGIPMLEKAFELQDLEGKPGVVNVRFNEVNLLAKATLLDLDTASLRRCMNHDITAGATVRGHVHWGMTSGIRTLPGLVIASNENDVLNVSSALVTTDKSPILLARLIEKQTPSR